MFCYIILKNLTKNHYDTHISFKLCFFLYLILESVLLQIFSLKSKQIRQKNKKKSEKKITNGKEEIQAPPDYAA